MKKQTFQTVSSNRVIALSFLGGILSGLVMTQVISLLLDVDRPAAVRDDMVSIDDLQADLVAAYLDDRHDEANNIEKIIQLIS